MTELPRPQGDRLRPSGGYRRLRSFQVATIIYDATVSFCERFMDRRSRTVDQMVQSARSGRQNIAEGSRAAATSSQTELKLVNVARASLDELLLDFEDYLRHRGLPIWTKDHPRALEVRAVAQTDRTDPTDRSDRSDEPYSPWLGSADPEVIANAVLCLIHQANFLLDRQISALERNFVQSGGYRERLAAARLQHRSDARDASSPACPRCGRPMVLRTARTGRRAGAHFWGCSDYPQCTAVCQVERSDASVRSDRSVRSVRFPL
jgi:restriction system protein